MTHHFEDELLEYYADEYHASTFERCAFKGNVLGVTFERCHFIDCTFDVLAGTQFKDCEMHGCEFKFIFRCVLPSLVECNFGDAMLSGVTFGKLQNCTWRGEPFKKAPLIVEGIEYPITLLDNGMMHIGCEYNTYEFFLNGEERVAAAMEGLKSARFWKRNKHWIRSLIREYMR